MDGRVQHIDIAKGISIFLVAIYHSKLKVYIPEIIEPMSLFRMPLFFFLSGVFFSWLAKPQTFLTKKTEALLKPYFFTLLIILFIDAITGGDAILWRLKGIFYGNGDTIAWAPLWFLTHLFSVYVFSYILFRYCNFNVLSTRLQVIVLLCFILIGSFYIQFFWYRDIEIIGYSLQLPGLPFSIDIILITSSFFIFGNIFKDTLIHFRGNSPLFIISLILFILIFTFTDAHMDLNKRNFYNPVFSTLGAFLGIYLILSISWYIRKIGWLSFLPLRLGESSLYILIFHGFIQNKTNLFFSTVALEHIALPVIAIITVLLSVSIPLAIKWVVLRNDVLSLMFLPFKYNKLLQRTLYVFKRRSS